MTSYLRSTCEQRKRLVSIRDSLIAGRQHVAIVAGPGGSSRSPRAGKSATSVKPEFGSLGLSAGIAASAPRRPGNRAPAAHADR